MPRPSWGVFAATVAFTFPLVHGDLALCGFDRPSRYRPTTNPPPPSPMVGFYFGSDDGCLYLSWVAGKPSNRKTPSRRHKRKVKATVAGKRPLRLALASAARPTTTSSNERGLQTARSKLSMRSQLRAIQHPGNAPRTRPSTTSTLGGISLSAANKRLEYAAWRRKDARSGVDRGRAVRAQTQRCS